MSWLTTRAPLAALGLALGCELFNSDPDIPEQCRGGEDVLARFDITVVGLPDASFSATSCTIAALGAALELDCPDGGGVRRVRIALTAEPAIDLPASLGDKVDFTLRRPEGAVSQVGIWTVHRESGDLLIGGNQANSTTPDAPEFFLPLQIGVDDSTCPELADEESCYFTQHLLLTFDTGAASATLTQGEWADLADQFRVQVERATQYRPGDGKSCQVDETLPAPYRFLVHALR